MNADELCAKVSNFGTARHVTGPLTERYTEDATVLAPEVR